MFRVPLVRAFILCISLLATAFAQETNKPKEYLDPPQQRVNHKQLIYVNDKAMLKIPEHQEGRKLKDSTGTTPDCIEMPSPSGPTYVYAKPFTGVATYDDFGESAEVDYRDGKQSGHMRYPDKIINHQRLYFDTSNGIAHASTRISSGRRFVNPEPFSGVAYWKEPWGRAEVTYSNGILNGPVAVWTKSNEPLSSFMYVNGKKVTENIAPVPLMPSGSVPMTNASGKVFYIKKDTQSGEDGDGSEPSPSDADPEKPVMPEATKPIFRAPVPYPDQSKQ